MHPGHPSPPPPPPARRAAAWGALLGGACGLGAFGWEELTNLVSAQPPMRGVDLLDLAWRYALPGALVGGLAGLRAREPGAVLLWVQAALLAFVGGGILSNLSLWGKLGQGQAAAVGFGGAALVLLGGLLLVLRWTRGRPHLRVALGIVPLLFLPTFRAANINAFGSAGDRGALVADALLLVGALALGAALGLPRALRPRAPAVLAGLLALPWLVVLPVRALQHPGDPLPAPARADRPDVLLVVIDTLRADHLGAYGYGRPISPHIDALAARGLRYDAAQSAAGWTLPSFASLHSGLYPHRHGSGVNPKDRNSQAPLPDAVHTLAEAMAAAGYQTGAIVSNPYLKRSFRLDQGFARYDDALGLAHIPMLVHPLAQLGIPFRGGRTTYRPADEMVDAALRWWEATAGGPRFLMLHLMDPHDPYFPSPAELAEVAAMEPRPQDPVVDRYDAEIRFADGELGRMLAAVGPDTFVALTADHGEEFGDRVDPYPQDRWPPTRHGHTLYQELLSVPLVVAGPGIAPGVVGRTVRSFDLSATLARIGGAAGFGPQDAAHDGRPVDSLALAEVFGEAPGPGAPAGSQAILYGTEKRAVRDGAWKLIRTAWGDELYDLQADPREADNRAAGEPGRVSTLAGALPGESAAGAAATIDEATRKQLEALGYVQ